MMEFERTDRPRHATPAACAAGFRHGLELRVLPEPRDGMAAVGLGACVPDAMAVGAEQQAFLGLAPSSFDAPEKTAEREVLGRGIAMMELERPYRPVVP